MVQYTVNAPAVVDTLNRILETELSGVVRYTHYSFMVFGPNRIPIVTWLRDQATESMLHAQQAGEMITHLGEHPSLSIGPLLETYQHDTMAILGECLEHETMALNLYRDLLRQVKDQSILIEEFARRMIASEEKHLGEVEKMMGKPGGVSVAMNSQ